MAASASSLALSTLNPFCVSRPASSSSSLLPPSLSFKLDSFSVSIFASSASAASRFVRSVAVTEDFEVEEGDISADDDASPPQQEQSFSADLKLFVGNLPFNVDSAQLAEIFEAAGNVEMVEVPIL